MQEFWSRVICLQVPGRCENALLELITATQPGATIVRCSPEGEDRDKALYSPNVWLIALHKTILSG